MTTRKNWYLGVGWHEASISRSYSAWKLIVGIPPSKSNITIMEHPPWMKMYFFLNMRIFHPVMLVFRGVELFVSGATCLFQGPAKSKHLLRNILWFPTKHSSSNAICTNWDSIGRNHFSVCYQGISFSRGLLNAMWVSGRVISPDMIRPARALGVSVGQLGMGRWTSHYHIQEIKLYKTRVKPTERLLGCPVGS